jgi:hypothetical protein
MIKAVSFAEFFDFFGFSHAHLGGCGVGKQNAGDEHQKVLSEYCFHTNKFGFEKNDESDRM